MTTTNLCEAHEQCKLVYMFHSKPQENDSNRNAAQANHRVDIKLNITHIQDTIHFCLKAVVVAGYHHCCQRGREIYSHYLPEMPYGGL